MKIEIGKMVEAFFKEERIPFALERTEVTELGQKLNCMPITKKLPDGSLRIGAKINGNDFYADFHKSMGQYSSWSGAKWAEKITIHAKDEDYKKTAIEGVCRGRTYLIGPRETEEVEVYGFVLNEGMIIVHAKYKKDVNHSLDIYIDYYDADVVDLLKKNGIKRQGGNRGLHRDFTNFTTFLEKNGISPDKRIKKSFSTTKDWCFIDILNKINYGYRIFDILAELLLQEVRKVEQEKKPDSHHPMECKVADLNTELQKALGKRFCQIFNADALKELGETCPLEVGAQITANIQKDGAKIRYIPKVGYVSSDSTYADINVKGLRKKAANFTIDFYTNDSNLVAHYHNWKYAKKEDAIVVYDDASDPRTLLEIKMTNDENMHFDTTANGIVLSSDGGMFLITTEGFYDENSKAHNVFSPGNIVLRHFDANIVGYLQEQGVLMPKVGAKRITDVTEGDVRRVQIDVPDVDFSKVKGAIVKCGLLPDGEYRWNNYDSSTARSKIINIFSQIMKDGERYCAQKCGNRALARKNPNEAQAID